MIDPLDYWIPARGYELIPTPITEATLADRVRAVDDFVIEATLIRMERHPDNKVDAARLRDCVRGAGLAHCVNLWRLWRDLWNQFSWLPMQPSLDIAIWLWGPPAKAGRAFYLAVVELGRGPIRRALSRAGWTRDHLRLVFDEWLDAARVHKTAADRAWNVFDCPRALPVIGRSIVQAPTPGMHTLAIELAGNDADAARDVVQLLPWIAARAQGLDIVSIPADALTEGRERHLDAPGLSARRGRKAWRLVQPLFARKTRGHRPGHYAAEYQIAPQYYEALGVT